MIALALLLRTHHIVRVSTFPALLAACQSAVPGDLIEIAKGVYTIDGKTRIAIDNRPGPVLVRGETGDPADVIIQGKGQDDEQVQMIFDLTDSPRWTFQDLTTRNSYYHGFKFNADSSDCVLRHVVMRDHGESGVKGTSDPDKGRYPDRLTVENCDIGFTTDRGGTRTVVEGIDGVGVNGWHIVGNHFLNVRHPGSVAYAVFTKGNSADTVIENNRFDNCDIGASFGGGGTGVPFFRDHDTRFEHRGGVIRNNRIVGCSDAGIYLNKACDARVYGNQLIDCVLGIALRFPQTTAWVYDNTVKLTDQYPGEPAIRVRDGATLLPGKN